MKSKTKRHKVIPVSRLRAAMLDAGGRPEDLASALGVSVFAVRAWIKGKGVRISNFKKFEAYRKRVASNQPDMFAEPVQLATGKNGKLDTEHVVVTVDGIEMKLRRGVTVTVNGKTIAVN